MTMANPSDRRVHAAAALIFCMAVVFYLFFQINKGGPFGDINPFGVDPYDAVGSFAFQIALIVGLLTYARALRLLVDPEQAVKKLLILRGGSLTLIVILVSLIADLIAEILSPIPASAWENFLRLELGLMFLLVLICTAVLTMVFKDIRTLPLPQNLTPADGIDDLWTLLRVPVTKARRFLPGGFVAWVQRFNSDLFFSRLSWINPRLHPWRFACALGLLAGIGLFLVQLREGLPPSLKTGLLVMGIFIGGEFSAALLGFAIFGGFLGLRPGK